MKGYTPQFRALGTPEGDFHAEFTTTNAATRAYVHRLRRTHPQDGTVQRFAADVDSWRTSLWETWTSALPTHLQPLVLSVRDAHHGPRVLDAGSVSFATFAEQYSAYDHRVRKSLATTRAARPNDGLVAECESDVVERLDRLRIAWRRFQAPTTCGQRKE